MKKIYLTRGQFTIVDDSDYNILNQYKWKVTYGHKIRGKPYATRSQTINGKKVMFFMHRVILNTPQGLFSDHINGDSLDNRRANLRIVTREQNLQNRGKTYNNKSGYKGVYAMANGYIAKLRKNGINHYGKLRKTKEEASEDYNRLAKKYHKGFAVLNK